MKKIRVYFFVVFSLMMLISCDKLQSQSIKTNLYLGQKLTIGVIGEPFEVREQQVKFTGINFSDLEKEGIVSQYDAVFIAKDNLSEAAQNKYKLIYKKSTIPFFFIENKKSNVPFTEENLSYEDLPNLENQSYISGFMYNDNKLKSWGFELNHENIDNKSNIEGFYSEIFTIISNNKTSK